MEKNPIPGQILVRFAQIYLYWWPEIFPSYHPMRYQEKLMGQT